MPSYNASRVKSLRHEWPAYLTFTNRTNVPVDIAWVDYRGNLVRYHTRLQPGKHHFQNTFLTHPWVAWNTDTHDKLLVGGQLVFEPKPWEGEDYRTTVYIDQPVLPLLKLCVQKIRLLVGVDEVEDLEIPRDLFKKLKKRHSINFRDYQLLQRER
uniref:von Hippel-Lindau disease tumour suppressor beta domain-containing protein n=1 Tax=Arion vulgaris TaxID=1028688 RepID=A0A0B6ZDI0_9EUPU